MKWILTLGFVAAILITACAKNKVERQLPDIDLALPELDTKAGNFATCDEVLTWRNGKIDQWHYYNPPIDYGGGDVVPVSSGTTAGSAPADQPTNTQEIGIDEPDILKTDGQRLFLARSRSVEIVNQDTLALEQTLDFPVLRDLRLYYAGGKLVVLGRPEYLVTMPYQSSYPPYSNPPAKYSLRIYERGPGGTFEATGARDFSGSPLGIHLKEGALTLVTTDVLDWGSNLYAVDGKINGVPCASIFKPLVDDFSTKITYVHRLDLSAPAEVTSIARFGRVDEMYVGQNALYLAAHGYDWFWRDTRIRGLAASDILYVSKYAFDDRPQFLAAGALRGWTLGQYSYHENTTEDLLYIFTRTMGNPTGNALWTLSRSGSDLQIASAPVGFSPGESLRSARFIGDKAYAVTYKNTDPLSVFDLSTPRVPVYVGEVNVPGFSSYLHPLANGNLLGVGYYDGTRDGRFRQIGVQVSWFDVSHPDAPTAIVQQTYGDRYSSADATFDPHAFFLDEAAGLLALPVTLFKKTYNPWSAGELEFSGAMILNPAAPSATYGKISHWDWIPENCRGRVYGYATHMDVLRAMKAGSSLITVSPFGVRASDTTNSLATTHELRFADGEEECTRLNTPWYEYSSGT